MFKFGFCIVFIFKITNISSLNILAISPPITKSHIRAFQPLFVGLADKGHNVTLFTSFLTEEKIDNYKEILIVDPEILYKEIGLDATSLLESGESSRLRVFSTIRKLPVLGRLSCRILFNAKPVQDFLKENNTFDLVITSLFNSDCALAIAKIYNCPIVRVSDSSYMPWAYGRFGPPLHPSYMRNNFLLFSDTMTFFERLENTLLTLAVTFHNNHYMIPEENELVAQYFGDSAKTLHEDIYRDSLLLVNHHFVYPYPTPVVPNVIEVGGISVSENKPLELVSLFFSPKLRFLNGYYYKLLVKFVVIFFFDLNSFPSKTL